MDIIHVMIEIARHCICVFCILCKNKHKRRHSHDSDWLVRKTIAADVAQTIASTSGRALKIQSSIIPALDSVACAIFP